MDMELKQFFFWGGVGQRIHLVNWDGGWLQVYEYRGRGTTDLEHYLNCLLDFSWQKCYYKNGMTMDIETEWIVHDSAYLETEVG